MPLALEYTHNGEVFTLVAPSLLTLVDPPSPSATQMRWSKIIGSVEGSILSSSLESRSDFSERLLAFSCKESNSYPYTFLSSFAASASGKNYGLSWPPLVGCGACSIWRRKSFAGRFTMRAMTPLQVQSPILKHRVSPTIRQFIRSFIECIVYVLTGLLAWRVNRPTRKPSWPTQWMLWQVNRNNAEMLERRPNDSAGRFAFMIK